jgi:hypothetical protein
MDRCIFWGLNVHKLAGADGGVCGCVGRCGHAYGWVKVGGAGWQGRWFDSHQLNCALIFLFIVFFFFRFVIPHIFIYHIFIFSHAHIFIYHIFIFSYFHIFIFHISYFISHISYFISHISYFQNTSGMNSVSSIGTMFDRTAWYINGSMYFLRSLVCASGQVRVCGYVYGSDLKNHCINEMFL